LGCASAVVGYNRTGQIPGRSQRRPAPALWVVQAPLLSIIGLDKYQEEASDGPPIVGTLYVQQWALRKLTGGDLPDRVRVTMTVDERET